MEEEKKRGQRLRNRINRKKNAEKKKSVDMELSRSIGCRGIFFMAFLSEKRSRKDSCEKR